MCELFITTYPFLGLDVSIYGWNSYASSKTSTYWNSWFFTHKQKKGRRQRQMRNRKIKTFWLCDKGWERQEVEGGSRGVTVLIERFELPGWAVKDDITYKLTVRKASDRSSGCCKWKAWWHSFPLRGDIKCIYLLSKEGVRNICMCMFSMLNSRTTQPIEIVGFIPLCAGQLWALPWSTWFRVNQTT